MTEEVPEYDKVTEASLNGIYVKAQELARDDNDWVAPAMRPPGAAGDAEAHASTHASPDAESDAGADAETRASDSESHASDSETHASD